MVDKEILIRFSEKFNKADKLIKEHSKFDSANEPFFSKYAARELLLELIQEIRIFAATGIHSDQDDLRFIGMQAACQLILAIIAFDTEEMATGESHLKNCEDIVHSHEYSGECAEVALALYNEYGVYHHRINSNKGLEYLLRAEIFYNNCRTSKINVLQICSLFSADCKEGSNLKFEASFTLTLYYLAQVYAQSNPLKSAIYCHRTLKRQLEAQDHTFDHIEWSLNAATLAQYFISKNCFKQARHHLAASSLFLDQYELKLLPLKEDENTRYKREECRRRSADISRCWAKYCYCLLISSKERLMADTSVDSAYTDISKMDFYENDNDIVKSDTKKLYFDNVSLNSYESIVTDKYISVYSEAKPVFLLALKYLTKAQEYYTLENMASDHIEIVQEQSKLYSLTLTFFEENDDNCAKLCKRAIDLLERVLAEVNSKYYLKYCQEMWHRLGQLYSNILDVKLDKHKSNTGRPSAATLKKINMLIDKSIYYFKTYINSLPTELEDSLVEPFLMSHFNIGALSRKYITYDKLAKHRNAKNSLKHFEIVLTYCQNHENAISLVSEYIPIAKELVTLLPVEIQKYEREMGSLD